MKRILIVDDEESICEILKFSLEKEGYDVETAYSGEEALEMDLTGFDLMLVDIMMERISGYDLVKKIRNNPATAHIPAIFCSALSDEDNIVMGLNIGGDDYITKPFNIPEVIARVRARIRRSSPSTPSTPAVNVPQPNKNEITLKGIRIDNDAKICYVDSRPIDLTAKEFNLLHYLILHKGRIKSRQEIIDEVWEASVSSRTVDTTIARLKAKIGKKYESCIRTRTGFGYGVTDSEE